MESNPQDRSKEQLLEVAVFLLLIVPSMVLSFFLIRVGSVGFVFTAVSVILRDLALVGLVLFFIWRNGESREELGWNFKNAGREVVLGIWLFFPMFFGAGLLGQALEAAGLSAPATPSPISSASVRPTTLSSPPASRSRRATPCCRGATRAGARA